jgi:hypothetical protein
MEEAALLVLFMEQVGPAALVLVDLLVAAAAADLVPGESEVAHLLALEDLEVAVVLGSLERMPVPVEMLVPVVVELWAPGLQPPHTQLRVVLDTLRARQLSLHLAIMVQRYMEA